MHCVKLLSLASSSDLVSLVLPGFCIRQMFTETVCCSCLYVDQMNVWEWSWLEYYNILNYYLPGCLWVSKNYIWNKSTEMENKNSQESNKRKYFSLQVPVFSVRSLFEWVLVKLCSFINYPVNISTVQFARTMRRINIPAMKKIKQALQRWKYISALREGVKKWKNR